MNEIREYGRWLIVPLIDEETQTPFQWDIHPNHERWSETLEVATGATVKDAIVGLKEFTKSCRDTRGLDRMFRLSSEPWWCVCAKCAAWHERLR